MISNVKIAQLLALDWASFSRSMTDITTSEDALRVLEAERARKAGPRKSYEMRIKGRISRLISREIMGNEEPVRRRLRDEGDKAKTRVSSGASGSRAMGRTTKQKVSGMGASRRK